MKSSFAAAASLVVAPCAAQAADGPSFSFVLLGDLHFDRLEHHDFKWLEREKPGDLSQIKNYSRITAEITPRLFDTVRQTVEDLNRTPESRVPFVLQVGDLVEGLCGSEKLAARQNREALAFVRDARLGAPLLFTKGNHDVTGDGATEAFARVFHPFLSEQTAGFAPAQKLDRASYTVEHGDALFCFFDAYDKSSLEWLEATLARRTARHVFVVIHPPVVPYGARSTWYLYSGDKNRAKRDKLLELLGRENAYVLGGHIHRFNTLTRTTSGRGRFVQVAVSSVIGSPEVHTKDLLPDVAAYSGDQIRVEPNYSPSTADERRQVYAAERPHVRAFQYADHPGYAVVQVSPGGIRLSVYSGISRECWTTVDLSKQMNA